MDISILRGLAFFSLLFVASALLAPEFMLALLPYRRQIWVVRRWTDPLWTRVTVVLAVILLAVSSWLVYSTPGATMEKERKHWRRTSTSRIDSPAILIGAVGVRVGR